MFFLCFFFKVLLLEAALTVSNIRTTRRLSGPCFNTKLWVGMLWWFFVVVVVFCCCCYCCLLLFVFFFNPSVSSSEHCWVLTQSFWLKKPVFSIQ